MKNQTTLIKLCKELTEQNNGITVEALAGLFKKHFNLGHHSSFGDVKRVCFEIGIQSIHIRDLPENIKGFFSGYDEGYVILLNRQYTGRERCHVLLHELYEIIQFEFQAICENFVKPEGRLLEEQADLFGEIVLKR